MPKTRVDSKRETAQAIPERITGWDIVKVISASKWGDILEARTPLLKESHVIKIAGDENHNDRILNEIQCLEALKGHPNIVQPVYAGEKYEKVFLVEEHGGEDLSRELKKQGGRLPYKNAVDISIQILKALSHAHKKNIIHCDLKPQNILLKQTDGGEKYQVKLCDFGISQAKSTIEDKLKLDASLDTEEGRSFAGTPNYMAPEQKDPDGKIDERTDIFSAGIVLYDMLAGKVPQGNPELPSKITAGIPEWLDEGVMKAFSDNPNLRFRSADEFADYLEKGLEGMIKNVPSLSKQIGEKFKSLGRGLWTGFKTCLKIPVYTVAYAVAGPFILAHKIATDPDHDNRVDHAGMAILSLLMSMAYYGGAGYPASQYALEYRLKQELRKNPPSGTIVYYDNGNYHLIDARTLPDENKKVLVPSYTGGRAYTLADDGRTFFCATKKGLEKFDLKEPNQYSIPYFNGSPFWELARDIWHKKEDGKHVVYARFEDQLWKAQEGKPLEAVDVHHFVKKSSLFPNYSAGSGKYALRIDAQGDLEITFSVADGRWGDLDIGRNERDQVGVRNDYSWIPVDLKLD